MDIAKIMNTQEKEEEEDFKNYHYIRRFAGNTCLEAIPMCEDDTSSNEWKLNEGGLAPNPKSTPKLDWVGKYWWAEFPATTEAAQHVESQQGRRQPMQYYQELYPAQGSSSHATGLESERFAQQPADEIYRRYQLGIYPEDTCHQTQKPAVICNSTAMQPMNGPITLPQTQALRRAFHGLPTQPGSTFLIQPVYPLDSDLTPNTAAQRVFRTPAPQWKYVPPRNSQPSSRPFSTKQDTTVLASQPSSNSPQMFRPSSSASTDHRPARTMSPIIRESSQDFVALAGEHDMLRTMIETRKTHLDRSQQELPDAFIESVFGKVEELMSRLEDVEDEMRKELIRRKRLDLGLGSVMVRFDWLVEGIWSD